MNKYIIFALILFIGCKNDNKIQVDSSAHAVLIHQDSTTIELEIINESIIHVKKYKQGLKPKELPDYVTVLKPKEKCWTMIQKDNQVIVETPKVKVVCNNKGILNYFTKDNHKILKESNKIDSLRTDHQVYQAFDTGDEGQYGLGQYQSGIMNWKNVPVRLQQFNQEIAVPFLVSTNNYGIYWHNYSVTDFNYPENEISFNETIDKEKNIRKTLFTPKKTGLYSFMIESENPEKNRFNSPVLLTIGSDTVIHYSTIWVPDCFSGQKTLEAGREYEVVFQNTKSQVPGKILFNEPDFNQTTFSSNSGDAIDYYFIYGNNPASIISKYSRLTGKAPMFPKSALGFWQCRERYYNQEELLENAREYRKRNIPFDNIVQDWNYWPKETWGPEWSRQLYPNPKEMVKELSEMNIQLMVSVWPMVKNPRLMQRYQLDSMAFGKSPKFLDFYNEEIQQSYYQMLKDSMFDIGVSSIWLDGTEPENKPTDSTQVSAGKWGELANAYSLLVNKAVYTGKRKDYPNNRVFNLTRSAYAGQQRYGAASWSGDVAATWEQLAEQIPAGLNFTMTGIPYWTTDIGGFFRDKKSLNPIYNNQYKNKEYIELLTRWFQFGTFNPIFRIHGYKSKTEIWRYGAAFENTARNFIDLRYKLMPYIYSEARKVTTEAKLLMSPMVYHYPNDKKTWRIKDQFFFGESILVCPVTKPNQRSKNIYLPEGSWYNFWSNEKIKGGRSIQTAAPLDQIPLFIKSGTILPLGAKINYATEETNEPLKLSIYPGKDAEYVLYFDDNTSNDYEKGIYSEIIIYYSDANKTISIKKGKSSYINFEKNPKNLIVEVINTTVSKKLSFSGKDIKENLN